MIQKNKNKTINVMIPDRASLYLFMIMMLFLMPFYLLANDFDDDEPSIEISGNIKTFNYIYQYINTVPFSTIEKNTPYASNNSKINIKVDYSPNNIFKSTVSYHLGNISENKNISLFNNSTSPSSSYRIKDLPIYINSANSETLFTQNLNRLNFKIVYSILELTIGRDALSKGSAKSINPTDLFSPFSMQNLDTEEKIGVDLIRVRLSLGDFSGLDMAYIMGKDLELNKSAFLFSYSTNIKNTTIEASTIYFYKNLLLGLDINTEILGADAWIESALVIPNINNNSKDKDKYLRITTGFDYMLANNLTFSLEYHFNGAGLSNLDNLDELTKLSTKEAYKHGGVYLLAKHYLIPSISYPITPLLNSSVSAMLNLTDLSILGILKLEYNIQENVYLDCNLFLRTGRGYKNFLPKSEFGAYPNIYNLSIRVYF